MRAHRPFYRGCWQNWVAYFQWLTVDRQLDHCRMLAEYRD